MKRIIATVIPIVFILLKSLHPAHAADIRAFHNINQLPLKQIFGLPTLDNSPLTEAGTWRFSAVANLSNTYNISFAASEQIANDAETFRGCLILSYSPWNNWQLSIELPYVNHDSGFLDDFIYEWHDFFSMPQNGRTKENSDQMQISYVSGSGSAFATTDSMDGIGDIRINGAFTRPWQNRSFIISAELKLPSGDFEKLTGSGGYDLALGLMLNDPQSLARYNITLYGGLAGVFLGDIDGELSDAQKSFVLAGRAGIGWQATKLIQLKLQLDTQSALYDSDLKELGDPALQLVMGGSLTFTESVYLDISVAEDISTSTAADVAFQLALVVTF